MIHEAEARQLHDRATRGEALSAAEQEKLEAWYAQQDLAESAALARAASSQTLDMVRAEIQSVLSNLRVVTQQIEALTAETEQLRRDNDTLQRALSAARPAQRA